MLNDIVMLLEIDRVLIKSFNAIVANFIFTHRGKIEAYMQEEDTHVETLLKSVSSHTHQWKKDQELLNYFMIFIQESLKFMNMGFFKR